MNAQTWSVSVQMRVGHFLHLHLDSFCHLIIIFFFLLFLCIFCREQLLQVLLRITEAVMKRPQENQKRDSFAESLASILFRVSSLSLYHYII